MTSIIFKCQFINGSCFYRSKDEMFRGLCRDAIENLFGISNPYNSDYTAHDNPVFELMAYNKKPKGKHIRVDNKGNGDIYINDHRYYLTHGSWSDLYEQMPPVFYVRLLPIKDKKNAAN